MNPIEQIWKELRARGFHNEVFRTLEKVVDRLCDTISNLSSDTIRRITGRDWIVGCFNYGLVLIHLRSIFGAVVENGLCHYQGKGHDHQQ